MDLLARLAATILGSSMAVGAGLAVYDVVATPGTFVVDGTAFWIAVALLCLLATFCLATAVARRGRAVSRRRRIALAVVALLGFVPVGRSGAWPFVALSAVSFVLMVLSLALSVVYGRAIRPNA